MLMKLLYLELTTNCKKRNMLRRAFIVNTHKRKILLVISLSICMTESAIVESSQAKRNQSQVKVISKDLRWIDWVKLQILLRLPASSSSTTWTHCKFYAQSESNQQDPQQIRIYVHTISFLRTQQYEYNDYGSGCPVFFDFCVQIPLKTLYFVYRKIQDLIFPPFFKSSSVLVIWLSRRRLRAPDHDEFLSWIELNV